MKQEIFWKVKCPVLMGYYYKDKVNQDQVVSVIAALKMFDSLGTPDSLKESHSFPHAGDHVIASSITSHRIDEVERITWDFSQRILKLKPLRNNHSTLDLEHWLLITDY